MCYMEAGEGTLRASFEPPGGAGPVVRRAGGFGALKLVAGAP